jgi:tetratricopeptide (TPR) repeat protein
VPLPKGYLQGCIDLVRGDSKSAQKNFETARPAFEKIVADTPQDATRRAQLGLVYALMGRKEDALREAHRALELKPISRDVIEDHPTTEQTRNLSNHWRMSRSPEKKSSVPSFWPAFRAASHAQLHLQDRYYF